MKEKIALLGVGNMGTAILEGLFEKKIAQPSQVWCYDKLADKVPAFSKKWTIHSAASAGEAVSHADVILLAVKPQDLVSASDEFKTAIGKQHTIISILAGTTQTRLRQVLGPAPKIIRAMPNLGAKVGEAITALTSSDASALSLAETVFLGCGKTIRLEESFFDVVTAISGSGPAYFFHLIELLEKIGVEHGLNRQDARLLAIQTAVGAGKLAQAADESPEELRVMVTSKGGTTEAALKILESENFPDIFRKAIHAAVNRSKGLSQK